MKGVEDRGLKAPRVVWTRGNSGPFAHGDGDARIGGRVVVVVDLPLQLLDLRSDVAKLGLHVDDVLDGRRSLQQRDVGVPLSLSIL